MAYTETLCTDNPLVGHPSSPSRVRYAAHKTRALDGSGRMTRALWLSVHKVSSRSIL